MIDADGEHQPAEQRGRDVVDVQRAARHLLALHRELEQLELAAAARGSSALAATTAATAEAAEPPSPEPSGMPLSISHLEAEARVESLAAWQAAPVPRCCAPARSGRSPATPRIARDAHARLVARASR